jgi:hypothetical protein
MVKAISNVVKIPFSVSAVAFMLIVGLILKKG